MVTQFQAANSKRRISMLKSTKRKYVFTYKYSPHKMVHYIDAPPRVANFIEREWKAAGLNFTKIAT